MLYFSDNRSSQDRLNFYSNNIQQNIQLNMLLLEFQVVARKRTVGDAPAHRERIDRYIDLLKSYKSAGMRSALFDASMDLPASVRSLGPPDSRRYKTSEVIEKIIGNAIFLKDKLQSDSDLGAAFSLQNEMYYFAVVNSFEVAVPSLLDSSARYFEARIRQMDTGRYTVVLGLVVSCLVAAMTLLLLMSLKKVYLARTDMMNVFIRIPDNYLKVYHGQCESFTLLFIGEDKHVDDLKSELLSLRKMYEGGDESFSAGVHGRRKKQLSHTGMFNADTLLMVCSIVACSLVYVAILFGMSSYRSQKIHSIIPFLKIVRYRPFNYFYALNSLLFDAGSQQAAVAQMFSNDAAMYELLYSHETSFSVYEDVFGQLTSRTSLCSRTSQPAACAQLLPEQTSYDDLIAQFKQLAYDKQNIFKMYDYATVVLYDLSQLLESTCVHMVSHLILQLNDIRILLFFLFLCLHLLAFFFVWIPLYNKMRDEVKVSLFFSCLVPAEVVRNSKRVRLQMMKNLSGVV